jgi:hypothetical protein
LGSGSLDAAIRLVGDACASAGHRLIDGGKRGRGFAKAAAAKGEGAMPIARYALHAACVAAFLGAGALSLPTAAAAAQEKSSMTAEEKKARSKECSAEADKRGLHGKERHKFRSKCKRETKS